MRVTAVRLYPVKSMGGLDVESAAVEPWGLAGDRRWALVDDAGNPVTAREVHALLRFRAEPAGGDAVRIVDRDGSSIVVRALSDAEKVPVGHSRQGAATLGPDEANRWVSERVGLPLRLVWQDDPTVRSISPERGGMPGESLSLADAAPLLLTSEASMAQLNSWISADAGLADPPGIDPAEISDPTASSNGFQPLSILRFRPNVVIDGESPFAEDAWEFVRIGDVTFRKTMICDRCVMTTLDPVTVAGGKEPIRTLARHRRWERKTWFGVRLVPVGVGTIHLDDEVHARSSA